MKMNSNYYMREHTSDVGTSLSVCILEIVNEGTDSFDD